LHFDFESTVAEKIMSKFAVKPLSILTIQ